MSRLISPARRAGSNDIVAGLIVAALVGFIVGAAYGSMASRDAIPTPTQAPATGARP